MTAPVLLVEDDLSQADMLQQLLHMEGFEVTHCADGPTGLQQGMQAEFGMIILDVMLPGADGFEVLRGLRHAAITTPVIMLTARGDDIDRIVGLELGADDYLPKPFNPRELVARMHAILRRAHSSKPADAAPLPLHVGELVINPARHEATFREQPLELTVAEFKLLKTLAHAAEATVTKATLSQQALGKALAAYDRSLDMHISNLRRKLQDAQVKSPHITTVRGVGYRLE